MSSGVEFEEDNFMNGRPAASSAPGQPTSPFSAPNQFATPNLGYGRPQLPSNVPKMSQWLMKHGIKSEHAAQAVLVAVIIFNIIVTIVVVKYLI